MYWRYSEDASCDEDESNEAQNLRVSQRADDW
jgi:hypothetical protein